MAIVIESSTIQDYIGGTDIGSDTQFSITAPTGITTGDLLLVFLQGARTSRTVNLPSGFTGYTLPNADGQVVKLGYKYAELADESAGSYTFTVTGDDNAEARWIMYRLSGAQSSGALATFEDGFNFTATGTSISQAVDVVTLSGGLLLTIITGSQTGGSNSSNFSALSLTGATVSMTERLDSEGTPLTVTKTYGAIYDGIPSADGDITNISFTYGNDGDDNDTIRTSLVFIRPQQGASATVGFATNTNTAFAPTGSAGANATPAFATNTNTAFAPQGRGLTQTNWQNDAKPLDQNWQNDTL